MPHVITKPAGDKERIGRLSKCYDCPAANIPTKVVNPGMKWLQSIKSSFWIRTFENMKDWIKLQSRQKQLLLYPHYELSFVKGGWEIPRCTDLNQIKSFKIYPDDVFIVTQPKCGTTWMQELTWLIANELDLDGAKCNQFYRVPFLEIEGIRRSSYILKGVCNL